MDFYTELENVISDMPRIGLEETGKVRLMNRTDRKYLANRNLLLKFLRLTKDEYSILVASGSHENAVFVFCKPQEFQQQVSVGKILTICSIHKSHLSGLFESYSGHVRDDVFKFCVKIHCLA